MTISTKKDRARTNNEINGISEVRLIDADGEQVGIVSLDDAKDRAADAELDLVELVPHAKPPVCRIMDYNKHLFELKQKQKEAKKKQKQIQVKEIKFRPGTDIGDYNIKLKKLKDFLEDGDKAKITIRFRGREMAHQELGKEMLDRIEKDLEELATVEQRPNLEGRQMHMVLAPSKKKQS